MTYTYIHSSAWNGCASARTSRLCHLRRLLLLLWVCFVVAFVFFTEMFTTVRVCGDDFFFRWGHLR